MQNLNPHLIACDQTSLTGCINKVTDVVRDIVFVQLLCAVWNRCGLSHFESVIFTPYHFRTE